MDGDALDHWRKRLLHRARYRGSREADILIGRFAERTLATMSRAELGAFESVVACDDHELCEWLKGCGAPPAGADPSMLARLKSFNASR
jgi:antitoxin CptB